MIEVIQQGLKEDGYEVSIAKLCRWFGVPRRTFYYKPIKKAIPKLQLEATGYNRNLSCHTALNRME